MDAFWHVDLPIAEQVIEVPKISSSSRHSRRRIGGSAGIRAVRLSVPAADR